MLNFWNLLMKQIKTRATQTPLQNCYSAFWGWWPRTWHGGSSKKKSWQRCESSFLLLRHGSHHLLFRNTPMPKERWGSSKTLSFWYSWIESWHSGLLDCTLHSKKITKPGPFQCTSICSAPFQISSAHFVSTKLWNMSLFLYRYVINLKFNFSKFAIQTKNDYRCWPNHARWYLWW